MSIKILSLFYIVNVQTSKQFSKKFLSEQKPTILS